MKKLNENLRPSKKLDSNMSRLNSHPFCDEPNEPLTAPPTVNIPSNWWAMHSLSEALAVLANNPDLMGDDVVLALESEAPDALVFLDALIADCHRSRYQAEADKRYADMVQKRASVQAARWERKKDLVIQTMQTLGVKKRTASAGTAFWSETKGGVVITDADSVPDEYKTAKPVEYSIDKRAIGRALDENVEVDGAIRGNGGYSLTIKG
jgi:hypothetical protein